MTDSSSTHSNGDRVVRLAAAGAGVSIEQLAALAGERPPRGWLLVAEVDGAIVTADALDTPGEPLADPFARTARVVGAARRRRRRRPIPRLTLA